jgi:hypothetical protein
MDSLNLIAIMPLMTSLRLFIISALGFTNAALLQAAPIEDLVISQYYEGTGSNKYIELRNNATSEISLSNYSLALWSNGFAENWKTNTGTPTATLTLPAVGLAPGEHYLIANTSAVAPAKAKANANYNDSGTAINFNGNDSVVLSRTGVGVIDAVSFTTTGNEGQDKSFYRLSFEPGFNVTAGSNVTTFPTVWGPKSLAEVLAAQDAVPVVDDWALKFQIPTVAPSLDTFDLVSATTLSTVSPGVTISFTQSAGVYLEYRVSEDATFAGAVWTSKITSPRTVLSAGTGAKTVYFQLRNTAGESNVRSDTIDVVAYTFPNQVVITQYYEGVGNRKYLEITNVTNAEVDVSTWRVARWTNSSADDWKYAGLPVTSPSGDFNISGLGTLAAGQVAVIANNGTDAPINGGTPRAADLNNANLSHNGNDSLALYSGPVTIENLVDVISIDPLADETLALGYDRSYVRISGAQGFGFQATDFIDDFATVWRRVALAEVDAALNHQGIRLGTYPDGPPPTPPYEVWTTAKFPGETDAMVIGFGRDPDADGILNGLEYFLGTDPKVASTALSPLDLSGRNFTFTHNRAKNTDGAVATYKWSLDLTTWYASGDSDGSLTVNFSTPSITDATNPDYDVVSVTLEQLSASTTNVPRLYTRLEVTPAP